MRPLLYLFLLLPLLAFGQVPISSSNYVFTQVDEPATFSSDRCAVEGDCKPEWRQSIGNGLLKTYIYAHIQYPPDMWEEGESGAAELTFVVEKTGELSDVAVTNSLGFEGVELELNKLVEAMQRDLPWVPARLDGKIVRSRYVLPVAFDLTDWEDPTTYREQKVYKVVSEMPTFPCPTCDDSCSYGEIKSCADQEMLDYIYDYIQVPNEEFASDRGGMGVVSFIVETTGELTNIKVVRNPGGPATEREMLGLMETMAQEVTWRPGRQHGRTVRVQFNLPIKFKPSRD